MLCHIQVSSLAWITRGQFESISRKRNQTMKKAYQEHPYRWSKQAKQLPEKHVVFLDPTADTRIKLKNGKAGYAA